MKKIQDNLGFYPFQKLYFFSTLNLSSIIESFPQIYKTFDYNRRIHNKYPPIFEKSKIVAALSNKKWEISVIRTSPISRFHY